MKPLAKAITTANSLNSDFDDEFFFNPSEILELLLLIKELRSHEISLQKIYDGGLQLNIGDSFYQIIQSADDERDY